MIYVITHKIFDDSIVDKEHYRILHVGLNPSSSPKYLRDDNGDNISSKNSNFCELTGIYWIWKNVNKNDDDVTGIAHYRRYFTTNLQDKLYTYFDRKPKLLNYSIITDTLKHKDIILPKRIKIFRTVKAFYADLHIEEDINLTKDAIKGCCPEYYDAYETVMNGHYFYYANMMICKRKYFDEYCSWLFMVMKALEPKIDLNKYNDPYQTRVFGFLSERLLQVWVLFNQLSIKEFPVFNVQEKRLTIFQRNKNRINKLLNK